MRKFPDNEMLFFQTYKSRFSTGTNNSISDRCTSKQNQNLLANNLHTIEKKKKKKDLVHTYSQERWCNIATYIFWYVRGEKSTRVARCFRFENYSKNKRARGGARGTSVLQSGGIVPKYWNVFAGMGNAWFSSSRPPHSSSSSGDLLTRHAV